MKEGEGEKERGRKGEPGKLNSLLAFFTTEKDKERSFKEVSLFNRLAFE